MTDTQERPRLHTEVDGDVWRITLDRPEAGNALDPTLAEQLAQALRIRPRETRTVLILANGPRFSVGGDISYFSGAEDPGAAVGRLAHDWHEVVRLLVNCPVPVVAGVQGAVAGAAVGLIGACDIVVCARSTKIRPAYAGIGFSPDGGSSWALTRALGAPRTLDLMLTDGALNAAEAHTFGLVSRLVEDADLRDEAVALAHQVAAGPVRAMVRTRALVRRAAVRTLDQQLDDEARLIAESAADPEGREGVRAFLEKRTPDFRGAV
jgi:2-(1,2-epoxy-1,2-dihydrophenyl)acetyl-CoA isomerase